MLEECFCRSNHPGREQDSCHPSWVAVDQGRATMDQEFDFDTDLACSCRDSCLMHDVPVVYLACSSQVPCCGSWSFAEALCHVLVVDTPEVLYCNSNLPY